MAVYNTKRTVHAPCTASYDGAGPVADLGGFLWMQRKPPFVLDRVRTTRSEPSSLAEPRLLTGRNYGSREGQRFALRVSRFAFRASRFVFRLENKGWARCYVVDRLP